MMNSCINIMGKTKIHILIVRPLNDYKSGDWIEGVVHVESHGVTNARAVRLKFYGYELLDKGRGGVVKDFIFNTYVTMWGYTKQSERHMQLPSGSLVFPFRVQLPLKDKLPVSEKYENGRVVYKLKAYIDKVGARNSKIKHSINVVMRVPNASSFPANFAIEKEEQFKIGCCTCSWGTGGHVKSRVRCLQPYVIPDKPILLTASIDNQSKYDVLGAELALIHYAEYFGYAYDVLQSAEFPVVLEPRQSFSNLDACDALVEETAFDGSDTASLRQSESSAFSLRVPSSLPPTFDGSVYKSWLELVFTLRCSGNCVKDLVVKFPVSIACDDSPPEYACVAVTYTPFHLLNVSTGRYPAYFSFDGMDYLATDQYQTAVPVAHPYFHGDDPSSIPLSLDMFNPTWRTLLALPKDKDDRDSIRSEPSEVSSDF